MLVPEETAEELYDHAPCGYLSALPDGTIVRVNQTLLDWIGYSRESLLGMRLRDLLPLPVKVFYETHFDPLLRMQGFVREMALELTCADGKALPVLINSVQHRDALGKPLVTRAAIFDATERRSYERELLLARRRAEQLAAVVDASADAIFIASPEGIIRTWNEGAERLFGYPVREAVGSSIRQLIVPSDYVREFEQVFELARSGQQVQLETVRVRKDGTRIDVSLSLTPHIEPPGELVAISAIVRDITERRRTEARLRQAEQLQSVATLAGGVAHEVNNQMAVVLGFSEFVVHGLGHDHPQTPDVKAMSDAAAKVAGLSQKLLAFSRQLPMVGQIVHLSELIDRLIPTLTDSLHENQALIVTGRARWPVNCDAARIEQIVVELTRNARDAMLEGGQLTISTSDVQLSETGGEGHPDSDVPAGEYVLLSVSDEGVGMDRSTISRAFEPFFTTKPFGRGTGLGLAMVHGVVKQHGGQLRIVSEPGRGTTIQIYLPAAVTEVHESGDPGAPTLIAGRPGVEAHLAPEYH
jgi:PAS domain S-box-containing protein